jgi:hypothetical protein
MTKMSTAVEPRPAVPEDFTALDRKLLERTEQALLDGFELERWCRDPGRQVDEFQIDLNRPYALQNRAFAYFSEVAIRGRSLPVIGVRQEVEFGRVTGPDPGAQLQRYVLREFLPSSHWTREDGRPGGFTYEQHLYCTADGRLGRYPREQRTEVQDWTLIGPRYRWSVFTVFLHDFVLRMGPLKKQMQEAATLVQHPDFVHVIDQPAPGYRLEVAIGYPFLDHAPIPNHFAFGPGKFDWAVKLFSFRLRDDGTVRCDMDFAAGARPRRVLDFGKHAPCPLYGTVDALQKLTFGLYDARRFHDWMDAAMMAQHARVHQALMEGAAKVFAARGERAAAAAAAPALAGAH